MNQKSQEAQELITKHKPKQTIRSSNQQQINLPDNNSQIFITSDTISAEETTSERLERLRLRLTNVVSCTEGLIQQSKQKGLEVLQKQQLVKQKFQLFNSVLEKDNAERKRDESMLFVSLQNKSKTSRSPNVLQVRSIHTEQLTENMEVPRTSKPESFTPASMLGHLPDSLFESEESNMADQALQTQASRLALVSEEMRVLIQRFETFGKSVEGRQKDSCLNYESNVRDIWRDLFALNQATGLSKEDDDRIRLVAFL